MGAGEKGMDDIIILHLSDLHIDSSSNTYSRLLKGLISDIKKELRVVPEKSVVVVVTGDILHKGDKRAVKNAVKFFQDLYKVIAEKVSGIYIVPGNHDKLRTKENRFLIPAYRNMGIDISKKFDKDFYESFWKYHIESYGDENGSGYLKLIKRIYEIFNTKGINNKKFVEDTFGVDIVLLCLIQRGVVLEKMRLGI